MDTRTHRQVEVVFEVLPPLAAAVALAAVVVVAAVVTLGGLVWSPAERERKEFLEAKYKRVGGTQCSENIMRNNNIKSNKRAKASQEESRSRRHYRSQAILASLIFMFNICLRLRCCMQRREGVSQAITICHHTSRGRLRRRYDSAYPKSNVSNCQHDIRADPHPGTWLRL